VYVPKNFAEDDPERVNAFVRRHPFGALVTWDGERPIASHLLMLLQENGTSRTLTGHMARANPQWKSFAAGKEVLAIFQGAHTYVSAAWYSVPSAPTWNYTSVHVYGIPRIVSDHRELYELLRALVDSQEAATPEAGRYRLESLSDELRESMMAGIVGFRITITRVEAAAKLSQNRSEADHARIIQKLRERADSDSRSVALEMERRGPGRTGSSPSDAGRTGPGR